MKTKGNIIDIAEQQRDEATVGNPESKDPLNTQIETYRNVKIKP